MSNLANKRVTPIRVLVVDDSALVRRILSDVLSAEPDIEVVGTASDPYVARERIVELEPDVITLDVEMPRMDGLSFLEKLMQHRPIPVVVVSSLTPQHSETALRALAMGAVDVIGKPGSSRSTADLGENLVRAVRTASHARVTRRAPAPSRVQAADAALAVPNVRVPRTIDRMSAAHSSLESSHRLIALGASTGGTIALEAILREFPADAPPTVIVQHMPASFISSFAERLDKCCSVRVREAIDGNYLVSGQAVIAPGGKHLVVQASGARWITRVKDGPMVHHQRPAVDVLFHSIARVAGRNAVGALLTGMGVDGARGLLAMREAGGCTISQDEATSIVYGMPREAAAIGASMATLPLHEIAEALLSARPVTLAS